MEITAFIISVFAFLLSGFTFFRFDQKIKRQEEIINSYEIEEINAKKKAKLYAHLAIDIYWRDKNTLFLTIDNDGPSDAYNIIIKDLDKESFLFQEIKSSFPINTIYAYDQLQIELLAYSDMPEKTRIQVDWDDDSKEHHSEKSIISIV